MAKTILIAAHDRLLRTAVRLAMSRAGYDVLEAGDGLAALELLGRAAKVHCTVCDMDMPDMDGIALLAQIKQHPRHRFIPVVMLATDGDEDTRNRGRQAGVEAWVPKPFNPPQLLDAVSKLALP